MSLVERDNFNESYAAVASSVPRARSALVDFAAAAGASQEQVESVQLASSEALTNVVLHAYPAGEGQIHVSAAITCGELWVLIADDGRGLRPRTGSPGLGVGLAIISQAADDFSVVRRSAGGTELRMRFSLRAAAGFRPEAQSRGSRDSATRPASPRFSTTR